MDVLFEADCNEPKGLVLRKVVHFPFTIPNLIDLWSKVGQFPTLMGIEINTWEDMINFFIIPDNDGNHLSRGICAKICNPDDPNDIVGIFWLTDLNWPKQASIHYTFFDRRHKGRIDLCKAAIKYIFETYRFHRLFTQVPLYASQALNFVEKIGFHKDGRLRSNTMFHGEWYDSNIYSILETEV